MHKMGLLPKSISFHKAKVNPYWPVTCVDTEKPSSPGTSIGYHRTLPVKPTFQLLVRAGGWWWLTEERKSV